VARIITLRPTERLEPIQRLELPPELLQRCHLELPRPLARDPMAVADRVERDRPLDELLAGSQEDFPVVERGRVRGMLYKSDLMQGLAEHGEAAPVSAVMCDDLPELDAAAPLSDALERFEEHGGRTLPVLLHGRLVGLLTRQNIGELFAARAALGHELHRSPAPA
jgi:CBS domain-containing protein